MYGLSGIHILIFWYFNSWSTNKMAMTAEFSNFAACAAAGTLITETMKKQQGSSDPHFVCVSKNSGTLPQ